MKRPLFLAPLRGVTIRCFRETFARELQEAGFSEALTPFISAMAGVDPLRDRELKTALSPDALPITPQFIGKDPVALRAALRRIKGAGFKTADLNCGCPFPMVRNKFRGSGILRTPDVLRAMMEVGCEEMGDGNFSIKARLGVERTDELLSLMPLINAFPLRFLTVHTRTAKEMYEGACHHDAFSRLLEVSRVPLVLNGDLPLPVPDEALAFLPKGRMPFALMIGRAFVRSLGVDEKSRELSRRYLEASVAELSGDAPVLGRMKELLSYWKDLPVWRRTWQVVKICRTVDELRQILR